MRATSKKNSADKSRYVPASDSSPNVFDQQLRELHDAYFREFEEDVVNRHAVSNRDALVEPAREERRRELLKSSGVNLKSLDAERKKDHYTQEQELEVFLGDVRSKALPVRSRSPSDAKANAVRCTVLAEAGHLVLPAYAASIYTADLESLAIDGGETGNGAINSGWVFPNEPGRIRIKDTGRADVWCFQATAGQPDPVFNVYFAFIPAATATYEMSAILAFHGFFVLRSDDSWYNCRYAQVKLSIRMNVRQYLDLGWKSFPALIDRKHGNVEEVSGYDRTNFFDYTTALRGGDPVIVTVSGTLTADARGSGAYAELNFESGTANYIEPLLLSVAKYSIR